MPDWTPTLRQLEMLLLVAQTGSLTRAAELLGVTQPAVSHGLRTMEDSLGYRLFTRTNGGLQPTGQTTVLLPQLADLHERFEALIARMRGVGQTEAEVLRVVALSSLSATLVPGALLDFSKRFPSVRVQALASPGREIAEMLRLGSVDFGVVYAAPEDTPDGGGALLDTEIVCFGTRAMRPKRARAATPASLTGHTVIVAGSDTATGMLVRRSLGDLTRGGITVIEANTALNALSLAREGLGVALVDPMLATIKQDADLMVWPFEPAIPLRVVALLGQTRDRLRSADELARTDHFLADLKAAAATAVARLHAASIAARLCA